MGYETQKQRRDFLKRLCCTLAAGGSAALLPQLNLMAASLGSVPKGSSHRALVCVNLSGGNDSWNWLIPRDGTRYAQYLAARSGIYNQTTNPGGLAIDQAQLLQVIPASGGDYGMHPAFADFVSGTTPVKGLRTRFNEGQGAFIANVGPLIRPITKTEYNNPANRPPQLFSHNDQTNLWHLGRTDSNFNRGWGGQVADRINKLNSNTQLSACLSISGSNRYQVGAEVFPYQLSAQPNPTSTGGGPQAMNSFVGTTGSTGARRAALDAILAVPSSNLLQAEYANVHARSLDLYGDLNTALAPFATPLIPIPNNSLALQLAIVARMIKAHTVIGQDRQIFYVSLGGFDTHDNQMNPTNPGNQNVLFTRINEAMSWFYAELEAWDLANASTFRNDVMSFTMSEFGRTLNTNGSGTDHAWGSVQMVLGGDVVGNRIYGAFPDLLINGPISFSRGQMIPSSSVDQIGATLATWMGVPVGELPVIFPNLPNFTPGNLGFTV